MRYRPAALTLSAAIIVFVISGACRYVEPVDQAMQTAAFDFVDAVERGDSTAAHALLSRDVRTRIDDGRFSKRPGDLQPVVDAFREAAISTRNARRRDEPALRVAKLGGRAGTIVAVMVYEEGEWKIANVLEWADPRR